jgi:hypothetical protein
MAKSKMNNQQISTIVSGMLATAQNKKALSLVAVKSLTNKVNDAEKQRFITSLELAQILAQTKEQFNAFCTAATEKLKDGGATSKELPKKDDFIKMVYGFQKSYYYKLIKVGELPKHVVNKFIDKCDEAEKDGKDFARSIEALNTWAKNFEDHKGEADADAESISDLRQGGDKKMILWQIKDGNKTLTMYTDHTHKTNFTLLEINAFFDEVLTPAIRSGFAIKKPTPSKATAQTKKIAKKPTATEKATA